MKSDKIHDIRPVWLRKLLTVCIFGPTTLVMLVVMWMVVMIIAALHQLYLIIMWWAVDYVKNVWNGEDKPDRYNFLDF